MRFLLPFLVAGFLSAQPPPLGLTRDEREADLRQLARETRAKWAYAEDRLRTSGIDPEALAESKIRLLEGVADDAAFVGLIREFVAGLQDGHASVCWNGKEGAPFRRWPFTIVDTSEGLVIDSLLPTWDNSPVHLLRGDLLVEVERRPVAQRIEAVERRTNASTAGARRKWALSGVVFNECDPSFYTVRRADGSEVTIEAAAAGRLPDLEARAPTIETRRLLGGIAFVRIPSFAHADESAWAEAPPEERPALLAKDTEAIRTAFAAAEGCRALVLDLRGNGGGTDLLAMEVASCLLPSGSPYYGLASRRLFGGWSEPRFHRLEPKGVPPRFAGQLVVLIDEGVFSASDNLCRCLSDLHADVTFVGRPTGGGTGAPRPCVTLEHSRAVISFCTLRVYGPDGGLIEGRGTRPDLPVRITREGWLGGRDEDLEVATRTIR